MNRVRTKVCGITRPEDAALAVKLGVDAIGMILSAQSPRLIDLNKAKAIRAVVPAFVTLVGVFVDESPSVVRATFDAIGLDLVQLHGSENKKYAQELNLPYIKAIRAKSTDQVSADIDDHPNARAILLDPYVKGIHGGTGTTLNNELWPDATKLAKPLILAGGLNAENIGSAASTLLPFAVDFNSGVETAPGIKSSTKLQAALSAVAHVSIV